MLWRFHLGDLFFWQKKNGSEYKCSFLSSSLFTKLCCKVKLASFLASLVVSNAIPVSASFLVNNNLNNKLDISQLESENMLTSCLYLLSKFVKAVINILKHTAMFGPESSRYLTLFWRALDHLSLPLMDSFSVAHKYGFYLSKPFSVLFCISNGWVLVPNPKDLNEKVTIFTEKLFLLVLIE